MNASKNKNEHRRIQQTRKRQPSLGTINEKKQIIITKVNTLKGNDHHQEQQIKKKKRDHFQGEHIKRKKQPSPSTT